MSSDVVETAWKHVKWIDASKSLQDTDDTDILSSERTRSYGAYIAPPDSMHVLAFRTTVTAMDWLHDLDFRTTRFVGSAFVHRGFFRKYRSLRAQMLEIVAQRKPTQLLLTGHSMGGAIACLAALDLHYQFEDIELHVVTFGSPRVGNRAFQDQLASACTSIHQLRDPRDLVPFYPFSLFGFTHGPHDQPITIHSMVSAVAYMLLRLGTAPRRFDFYHFKDSYDQGMRSSQLIINRHVNPKPVALE